MSILHICPHICLYFILISSFNFILISFLIHLNFIINFILIPILISLISFLISLTSFHLIPLTNLRDPSFDTQLYDDIYYRMRSVIIYMSMYIVNSPYPEKGSGMLLAQNLVQPIETNNVVSSLSKASRDSYRKVFLVPDKRPFEAKKNSFFFKFKRHQEILTEKCFCKNHFLRSILLF